MTNTPKDKTPMTERSPQEIAEEIVEGYWLLRHSKDAKRAIAEALAAERQKVFNAEHDSGIWQEKIVSLERELAEALDELIPLRMVHNAYATCCKERKELTAENDRLTIKATNWEIVAAGFEEWAIHLRDEINEALSFGPTYKPELKGWVAQFVEWQKRMRESIWIKKPEALASPTTAKRCDKCGWPLAKSVEEGCVEGNCSMRPVPKSKGDSAGPEKHDKDIERIAFHYAYYDEIEAVIEAVRNMMKVDPSLLNNSLGSAYAIKHYCEVRQALEALDRARGEGKSDGH